MQQYTVPAGITVINIEARGAQGGNNGGMGAIISGDVNVTPGETINILVGGAGTINANTQSGGGGGTFVVTSADVPLIIAGGGGGRAWSGGGSPTSPGIDANTTENGNNGYSLENLLGSGSDERYGLGGVMGNGGGGSGPDGTPHAGNGGGFFTNGANGDCGGGGQSYLNGGAGGTGCSGGSGGYGGGGNGGNSGGGGGGGYSGGGGSYHNPTNGGGGGSFNSGTNQVNSVGNTGNGLVIISEVCSSLTTTVSGTTYCVGEFITLDAVSTNGGVITWDNGLLNNTPFELTSAGNITFTATSDNILDCPFSVDILVNPSPVISLTTSDEFGGSDGGVYMTISDGIFPFTFDWDNDGTGDFDDTQNLTNVPAGNYTVVVSQGNGCTTTASATVDSQLGLENRNNQLSVYPNPANSEITISKQGEFNYSLMDASGRIIIAGIATNNKTIDVSTIEAGMYFVKVIQNGQTSNIQLIVQ